MLKITISDLTCKQRRLEKNISDIEKLCQILQSYREPAQTLATEAGLSSGLGYPINEAKGWLQEYLELLKHLMSNTYFDWPPNNLQIVN